jgi:hypothetical protein
MIKSTSKCPYCGVAGIFIDFDEAKSMGKMVINHDMANPQLCEHLTYVNVSVTEWEHQPDGSALGSSLNGDIWAIDDWGDEFDDVRDYLIGLELNVSAYKPQYEFTPHHYQHNKADKNNEHKSVRIEAFIIYAPNPKQFLQACLADYEAKQQKRHKPKQTE